MKAVLQNLASVVGGEAAVRAANFVVVLFISREYGAAALGAYAVSLAVSTVVVMFADNGLQTAAITQLSSANPGRRETLAQLTIAKTTLLAVAAMVLAGIALGARETSFFLAIGAWVSLRAMLQSYSQFQMAVLKSVAKARWIGIIQALHSAALFLGIWLSFERAWNIFLLLMWLTLCQLLELLLATVVLYKSGMQPRWPQRLRFLATIKMAAPFGIAYGLANLIIRADTIVLSAFAPLSEVGSFSAANTALLLVYVSSWLFGSILLPEMVQLSGKPEEQKAYANQWARRVLLVAVPCAVLFSIAAPRLISLLYGPAFVSSGTLGSIMALACPFILLNSIYTTLAFAANGRSIFLGIYGAGAVATFILDFALGRSFGSLGIACAIVIREALIFLAFWLLTLRSASPAPSLQAKLFPEVIESPPPR
jgi:O-antigen/teichoic acid export membrane protein